MDVIKAKEIKDNKKFEDFLKDRHEALLSCDKEKFVEFAKKYNVPVPQDERVIEVALHKARVHCTDIPIEERERSADWLADRGFSVGIGN